MRKPNILLITADQMRGDCLGLNGNKDIHTPNLDDLGRRGVNFTNAFSTVPICVPARYSIMTGRVPNSFGIVVNGGHIPLGIPTLPGTLSKEGYYTGLIGKAHFYGSTEECKKLGIKRWRYPYGFHEMLLSEEGRQWKDGGDDYQNYLKELGLDGFERGHGIGNNDVRTSPSPLPEEHYQTSWCMRESLEWIRKHVKERRERPFFLWSSFIKPHSPYDPPEPWDKMYDPAQVPKPIGGPEDIEGLCPIYESRYRTYHWDTISPQAIQRARAFYYGMISQIDDAVGKLLKELEILGIADNTIVIFVADHGDLMGDHGLFFKSNFFRESWHIPFIIYAPDQIEGIGNMAPFVGLQDLMPTICSLAGITEQPDCQGIDLSNPNAVASKASFGTCEDEMGHRILAVRTDKWQYVFHEGGGYEELYDLQTDFHERKNIAGDSCTCHIRDELKEMIIEWLKDVGDTRVLEDGKLRVSDVTWETEPPKTPLGLRPY